MYDAEAVNAAVVLSSRYIADRQLPDKAIDLMDEAGSRVRIAAHAARRAVLASGRLLADRSAPWMELQQVLEAKEEAIKVHCVSLLRVLFSGNRKHGNLQNCDTSKCMYV